jgi:hypothetical protein
MSADREIEIERWRGMTLHAQIIEWRDRAVEAEAERDRLRSALDVCEAERDRLRAELVAEADRQGYTYDPLSTEESNE